MRYGMTRFAAIFHGKPMADAIPTSSYGQDATNDPRIPRYLLPWLDRHFRAVFGVTTSGSVGACRAST